MTLLSSRPSDGQSGESVWICWLHGFDVNEPPAIFQENSCGMVVVPVEYPSKEFSGDSGDSNVPKRDAW